MKTFSDLKGDLLLTEFRIWCPNHPSLLLRYQNDGLPCYPRIAALSFKGFIYKVSIFSVLLDAVLFHQEVSYENWVVHICNGFVFDLSANTQSFPVAEQMPKSQNERLSIYGAHTPFIDSLMQQGKPTILTLCSIRRRSTGGTCLQHPGRWMLWLPSCCLGRESYEEVCNKRPFLEVGFPFPIAATWSLFDSILR